MVSSIKSGSGFSQQVERHLDTEGWEVVGQKQLAQSVVLLDARLQTELGVSAQVLVMVVEGANTAVGKTHLSHLSQYETKVGADGAALVAQAGYDETFRESAEMQNISLLEPDEIESSLKRFLTPTISSADISRRHVLTIGGIAAIGGLVGIGIRNDLTSSIPAISGNESNFPAADSVPSLDNSQHDAIEVVEKVLKASYEDDTNTIEEYHHPDLGDDRVISRVYYQDATGEASFEIQELSLTEENENQVIVTAEIDYNRPIDPSQDTWEFVLTQTEDSDWRICNGEQTAGTNHGLRGPLPNGC